MPFTFGQDINISMQLFAVSGIAAYGNSYAKAEADYQHTMTWSGLSNVRDAAGNLLTGYTALSADSGFNFANPAPVPEPTSAVLWLAGLSLVSVYRRRTHRHDPVAVTRLAPCGA
jgi:hypothetical protein